MTSSGIETRASEARAARGWFRPFAHATAEAVGRSEAFLAAAAIIVAWALTGPIFHYSDTWQLVINTGTTIVTFLMVFLIQNTQNRDAHAMHLKLDELIRASKNARNSLLGLESMADEDLARLQREFEELREHVVHARRKHTKKRPSPSADDPSGVAAAGAAEVGGAAGAAGAGGAGVAGAGGAGVAGAGVAGAADAGGAAGVTGAGGPTPAAAERLKGESPR